MNGENSEKGCEARQRKAESDLTGSLSCSGEAAASSPHGGFLINTAAAAAAEAPAPQLLLTHIA